MCKDMSGTNKRRNFMYIDFDKVNKRGYDDSENIIDGDPSILFKKPGVDPNKEMALTFMVNIYDSMITASVSKPNELNESSTPLYTITMNITDEDTLDKFFEFATDHFFIALKSDDNMNDPNIYKKALDFLKDNDLDIQLIKLKDSISSDGSKKCRTFIIEGNEKPFIENNDSDSILTINVKGYGIFELYADYGVVFNIPDGFGTDETVTSDITHILKCMKDFRAKIDVLGLFSTLEDKCNTFNNGLRQLKAKLAEGLSPLEEDGD